MIQRKPASNVARFPSSATKLFVEVAELLALGGAAGRVVFRVEVEDEISSFGFREAEVRASRGGKLEVGRRFV